MATQKTTVVPESRKKPHTEQQMYRRLNVVLFLVFKWRHRTSNHAAITTLHTLGGTQL